MRHRKYAYATSTSSRVLRQALSSATFRTPKLKIGELWVTSKNRTAMKQFFKMMMFIVAATMAFAACSQQYEDETQISAPTIKVTATMLLEATRSSFGEPDGKIYPTEWDGDEEMKYALNLKSAKDVTPVFADDMTSATAELELTDDGSNAYTISMISPASADFGSISAEKNTWGITIPTTQEPKNATSCDPAAQILYAVSNTSDVLDASYTLPFQHATAYGKMTLQNLALNGAVISSVALTADADLAGRYNLNITDGSLSVNSGAKSITINTNATENIWFACAPVAFTELKVTVTTDKGIFTKTISASKAFKSGKIAVFSIDMSGVAAEKPAEYMLLTDVADLNVGDQVILANTEAKQAISSTQNGNNRGQASVTIDGDCIVAPGDGVEIFEVEEGTKAGTFAFKATKTAGYIYAASSGSNYLRTETTLSDNSSMLITIANGETTIVAQGSNTRNNMRYNATTPCFSFYAATSSVSALVDVYYLPSGNAPATPKISASDIADVPAEGVQNATAEITKKNITGEVTVTKDGTVVTAASLSGETLTYTVSANSGDAREGWIKLAADGAECTIKVSQVANPDVAQTLPYEESLTGGQALFTIENTSIGTLSYVWTYDSRNGGYMKASAYAGGAKAAEAWLVSPLISLEGATNPELTFTHAINYANSADNAKAACTVWVSKNGGAWEQVTVPTYPSGTSWDFVDSGAISLSKYVGSIIKVGFKYTSTNSVASTWEVKNFKVAEAEGASTTTPLDTPEVTATAEGNTITVSWKAITGAKDYTVTCAGTSKTITGTSAEFTGLAYSTKYDVTVVANPTDAAVNTVSEAGKESATTEADPNAGGSGDSNAIVLTGENMAAMTNAGTPYNNEKTYTDGTYTWVTNGWQDSKITNMIQLRVRTNSKGVSWIKLPTFAAPIKDIKFSVTSASAASEGADQTDTRLYYQETTAKDATIIVSAGGTETNEIVMDLSDKSYTTGYITANGGIRIWKITVTLQGEGGGGDTPATTPLKTPTLTATTMGNQITVMWGAVENAKNYTVSCGDKTQTIGAEANPSATFIGLEYATQYKVTVVANPENTTLYSASAPATKTITTGQNPNPGTGSGEDITLTFTSITNNANNYTTTWEQTCNGKTWSIANFNNNNGNNGWTYIKCGSKNGASVASIATKFPIATAVKSVKVTVDAVTASAVKSTYLQVATDDAFSNVVETVNVTIKQGEVAYNITNPQANRYYKLVYDCAQSTKNGTVQISKVVYSAQ